MQVQTAAGLLSLAISESGQQNALRADMLPQTDGKRRPLLRPPRAATYQMKPAKLLGCGHVEEESAAPPEKRRRRAGWDLPVSGLRSLLATLAWHGVL